MPATTYFTTTQDFLADKLMCITSSLAIPGKTFVPASKLTTNGYRDGFQPRISRQIKVYSSISRQQVDNILTKDSYLSSKSTSALGSISRVTETTMATQGFMSSLRNKMVHAERDTTPRATVNYIDAGIMVDRSPILRSSSTLKGLIKGNAGLDSCPLLNAEILFQLAGPYNDVSIGLRMIRVEQTKLTNILFTLANQTDNADITFEAFACRWTYASVDALARYTKWTLVWKELLSW